MRFIGASVLQTYTCVSRLEETRYSPSFVQSREVMRDVWNTHWLNLRSPDDVVNTRMRPFESPTASKSPEGEKERYVIADRFFSRVYFGEEERESLEKTRTLPSSEPTAKTLPSELTATADALEEALASFVVEKDVEPEGRARMDSLVTT